MPIDYSKYPHDWKTVIRPAILERDGHKCKFCRVPNKVGIFRGTLDGVEIYQTGDGAIYRADNSEHLMTDCMANVQPLSGQEDQQAIMVVLTIAHLDHDIENNDYANLAALCQRCHNRHDVPHRKANARQTNNDKKGLRDLFKTS